MGSLALAVAACSPTDGAAVTYPVGSIGPDKTVSPAVAQTRGQLVAALGDQNLILNDTVSPYRPPESASLASAPRAVYQVTLPADPNGGFIVVYEFTDTGAAAAAAAEQQAYLATGPGAVQSPLGTVHVLRQVGNDARVLRLAAGLEQGPGRPGHPGRPRDARERVLRPGLSSRVRSSSPGPAGRTPRPPRRAPAAA